MRTGWAHWCAPCGLHPLSELYLVLGELAQAEAHARDSVDHADKSDGIFLRVAMRITQAYALQQLGQTSDARALFPEAERMHAEWQPDFPLLYGLQGYRYCDLLLSEGEAGEVLRRAEQTLTNEFEDAIEVRLAHDHPVRLIDHGNRGSHIGDDTANLVEAIGANHQSAKE